MVFHILQTYFITSIKNHAPTFKTITLSFDVTNLQTISRLKNSNPTYEYVRKYVQICRAYIKMTVINLSKEHKTESRFY